MVMMIVWVRLSGNRLATPVWRWQLSRGLNGVIAMMCYFWAMSTLPLATAVTLNYTSTIFIALLLAFWLREPLHPRTFMAGLIGFGGVILVLQPSLASDQWRDALIGLASGVMASFALISVRELGRAGEPEVRTVFYFSCLTTLGGLLWVIFTGGFHRITSLPVLGYVLGVGILGGGAQLSLTRAYSYGKTIVVANFAYATVIFASLLGYVFWHERLGFFSISGMALIILGGVAVTLSSRRH